MTNKDKLTKLTDNIWITRGARFNAYRRLARKNYASIFTISILSFFNIGLALFPQIIDANYIAPATVAVSVFILVISLLEAGKNYAVKSERMHQNAVDLNQLLARITLQDQVKQNELENYHDEYCKLIKSCPDNHNPCDDKLFRTEHPHHFNLEYKFKLCREWKIKKPICHFYALVYLFETFWLYATLIIIPIVALLWL